MDQTTETIVNFAGQIASTTLAESTINHARRLLVDSLACMVGGFDGPPARIARAMASEISSGFPASVAGNSAASSAELAAFANTVAVRYLDFNDTFFSPLGGGGHPSDLIPTVLAVGDATAASGHDALVAIVAAYEIWGKLAGTVRIRERGWDQGIFTEIAAAVATGLLLDLTPDQMAHAISLAVIPNIPARRTRAGALSMWKGCATAGAARSGIFAAQMASRGMTGPPEPFEGPEGIWDQVTGPFSLDLAMPTCGSFVAERTHLKSRPAEYNAQGPLDLITALHGELSVESIERIDVDTYWLCWSEIGHEPAKWDPKNRETADHSLPYLMAVGLVDGRVDLDSFTDKRVQDPALRPLMDAIHISERADLTAAFPREIGCRLHIKLAGGEVVNLETMSPRGHADNPLSDSEINAKFDLLTRNQPANVEVSRELRDAGWNSDSLARISELTSLFGKLAGKTGGQA